MTSYFSFWIVLVSIVGFVALTWLAMRSGHKYSVHDTESHSSNYADVIKEGHGGLTAFLWICFIAIFIWTIAYLVQHGSEFSVIFSS
jgi:hypothetical protein